MRCQRHEGPSQLLRNIVCRNNKRDAVEILMFPGSPELDTGFIDAVVQSVHQPHELLVFLASDLQLASEGLVA